MKDAYAVDSNWLVGTDGSARCGAYYYRYPTT